MPTPATTEHVHVFERVAYSDRGWNFDGGRPREVYRCACGELGYSVPESIADPGKAKARGRLREAMST